jgi:hypothetical protein
MFLSGSLPTRHFLAGKAMQLALGANGQGFLILTLFSRWVYSARLRPVVNRSHQYGESKLPCFPRISTKFLTSGFGKLFGRLAFIFFSFFFFAGYENFVDSDIIIIFISSTTRHFHGYLKCFPFISPTTFLSFCSATYRTRCT